MASINEHKILIMKEAQAERKAAVVDVSSTSFEDCLRSNNLPIAHSSSENRKPVEVRGQDINKSTTWQKFLAYSSQNNDDLTSLVDNRDHLVEGYTSFLTTSHTERYRNFDLEGQRWLRKVVYLAVTYHIMENKLNGYLAGESTFANDEVAYLYTLVRTMRMAMANVARAIQHIVKDEEKAQQYISDFFSAHYEQFRTIPFPQQNTILRLLEPDKNEDVAI